MLQLTNAFIGAAALDLVVDGQNVNLPVDQAIVAGFFSRDQYGICK
jgi:hypothetical protein